MAQVRQLTLRFDLDEVTLAVLRATEPRVLCCGSRHVARTHLPLIRSELELLPKNTVVVHGSQGLELPVGGVISGADLLAAAVAKELGLRVEAHPAAWKAFGDYAGPHRNTEMVRSGVHAVIAWWDGSSPGTFDTITKARRRGLPVRVVMI